MDIDLIVRHLFAVLIPMLLSLTVHEYAHGLSASLLGDDTAKMMGRLTLNPISHADPIGTILLPAMIVVLNASSLAVPFFGWARPVPFNPLRFDRRITMSRGIMLTAVAGPVSNLVLASVCAGALAIIYHSGMMAQVPDVVSIFLVLMVQINLVLAIFNMIPVYPLDGQKVVSGLLGGELGARFDQFSRRFGMFILIFIIMFGGRFIMKPFVLFYVGIFEFVFHVPLSVIQEIFSKL